MSKSPVGIRLDSNFVAWLPNSGQIPISTECGPDATNSARIRPYRGRFRPWELFENEWGRQQGCRKGVRQDRVLVAMDGPYDDPIRPRNERPQKCVQSSAVPFGFAGVLGVISHSMWAQAKHPEGSQISLGTDCRRCGFLAISRLVARCKSHCVSRGRSGRHPTSRSIKCPHCLSRAGCARGEANFV